METDLTYTFPSEDGREPAEGTFVISPSGQSKTCRYCGTTYDIGNSIPTDDLPPVGDGCDNCDPEGES